MGKFQDLTGRVFGRLTVEGIDHKVPRQPHGSIIYWRCRCDCGNVITTSADSLRNSGVKSCGCLRREKNSKTQTKHGMAHTKIYSTWENMMRRCYSPKHKSYLRYGARGIIVCERWHNFEKFFEDVSQMEHFGEIGYTLDRRDNNSNYEPENVRFATRKEQNRNTNRNILVEFEGELMALSAAAELTGLNYGTLRDRYYKGERGANLFRPIGGDKIGNDTQCDNP